MGGYSTSPDISPERTLAVVTTGIVDDPRCISNLDQLAKTIVRTIRPLYEDLKQSGTSLKQIVIAGPPCIASAVDKYTTGTIHVTSHHQRAEQYLDDTKEVGDGFEIPSVRQGRPTVGQLLASEGRLSEDAASEFDLSDSADRARIEDNTLRKLDPRRHHRARQKAQSKRLEHLLNDWFDQDPTAEHVLIVGDGRNTHQHLVNQTNGESDWIKYPSVCDNSVTTLELDSSNKNGLSWALAAVFDPRHRAHIPYQEFSPQQRQQLHQWLTEATRQDLGYPPARQSKPIRTQAATSSGKATSVAG